MLDQGWQRHHVLQSHPVHHLDVVVSDQLGGGDWGEPTVIELTSHAGVTDLGWDREEVRQGVRMEGKHQPTCGAIQLLHLLGVGSLEELVQIVLSG